MICFKKRAYILLWSLICLINLYPSFDQFQWIYHVSDSIQDTSLSCFFLNKIIKFLFIASWNNVPKFCFTCMTVINRIKPWVFNMPTKWREHHSHIDPRYSHSTNKFTFLVCNFEYRCCGLVKVVDVKEILFIVEILVQRIFWIV